MSEEKQTGLQKILEYRYVILAVTITLVGLAVINIATIDEAKASAPCELIKSPLYEIPDNVITKGYDIIRDEDGKHLYDDCYYIKNAGLIERIIYNWELRGL
jgi:hypothetical protein